MLGALQEVLDAVAAIVTKLDEVLLPSKIWLEEEVFSYIQSVVLNHGKHHHLVE